MPHLSEGCGGDRCFGRVLRFLMAVTLVGVSGGSARAGSGDAVLDKTSVPAPGRHRVHAEVKAFGRYGITVKSPAGTALRLVDKVAGPGPEVGRPGGQDGRLDVFLDRGTYRVGVRGDDAAKGQARLRIRPFAEQNVPAPQLVEHRPVEATLDDFQQRSYWIDIPKRRWVAFEAAGRNLSDLRLFKDGTWLVDATPGEDVAQPREGRPLRVRRLIADLKPGLYLLTAYGGPPKPWAQDDGQHPLHLRFGIQEMPDVLRKRFVIGPLGYDRFVVQAAGLFRIERTKAGPLSLEIRDHRPERPYSGRRRGQAQITKKSVPPVAQTQLRTPSKARYMVTVRGVAGQPYVLQWFDPRDRVRLSCSGQYWVSSVHTGRPEDSIDATGVLVRGRKGQAEAWSTPKVSKQRGWHRRFNLLDTATVFLDVTEAGSYRIAARKGAVATYRIEPFLLSKPKDYRAPKFRGSGSTWDLAAGLHVMTLRPKKKGILNVSLSAGDAGRAAAGLPNPVARFESLWVSGNQDRYLSLNRQPGGFAGLVVRRLPLDLRRPLPVAQRPQEELSVQARFSEEGRLYAEAEDGRRLSISVDGGPWSATHRPSAGDHTIRVKHEGKGLVMYSLGFEPKRFWPDTPLPPLPDRRLASRPKLPVLDDEAPVFFDLERKSSKSFLVNARSPGLYRLETTGLLETEGNLRTRMVTSLVRSQANGVGRNFLVQQYLGTGDYQITVSTRGRTRGHLGLQLAKTPAKDGGRLTDGMAARVTLKPGQAITYTFTVPDAGRYRLRSLAQGKQPRGRLEDKDGWPLEPPDRPVNFDRWFEAGTYRLVVLPTPVKTKVVTLLEAHRPDPTFEGHGPHALPLDRVVQHIWAEPPQSSDDKPSPRPQDVWTFFMPAEAEVSLSLSGKMYGDLVRADKNRTKVAAIPPLRGWTGTLARGAYRLQIRNLHQTSDVPYTVKVQPKVLMEGLSREFRAPVFLPVAVGETGLFEVVSFGKTDVRAWLVDADGRTVLKNDDRADDWSFLLSGRLTPGRYRLHVEPVGAANAQTEVMVRRRQETTMAALTVPVKKQVEVGRSVHVFPVKVSASASVIVVHAASAETLGLLLEHRSAGLWTPLGTAVGQPAWLAVSLAPEKSKAYRLKVWSLDERNQPLTLRVAQPPPVFKSESDLASGFRLTASEGLPIGVAEVQLTRPGTFRSEDESLRGASVPEALTPPNRGLLSASGKRLWLARPVGRRGRARVKATRVVVKDEVLPLSLSRAPVLVDVQTDGLTLARVDAAKRPAAVGLVNRVATSAPGPFDVGGSNAVSVYLGQASVMARVWPTDGATDGGTEAGVDDFDARLQIRRFESPAPQPMGQGTRQGDLASNTVTELTLVPGRKRFHLALEEGTVAVVADTAVQRVVWAHAAVETFHAEGTRLLLFNPTPRRVAFSVEVLPDASPVTGVFAKQAVRAERRTLRWPPGKAGRRVRVRGAQDAMLFHPDGRVSRGDALELGAEGGQLRFRYDPGPILVWLDDGASFAAGLMGSAMKDAVSVSAPRVVALTEATASFQLQTDKPRIYHVRLDTPGVLRWTRGPYVKTEVLETGGTVDVYLPDGSGRLDVRPLFAPKLSGQLELTASSVRFLGEGLGPEVMLAPGAARTFAFAVKSKRKVGLGVRADAAAVTAVLSDVSGKVLGQGVVQMRWLERGVYLLTVRAPDDGRPTRARPAVVGLDPPPTGPPEDEIKKYLSAAGYEEARR